MLCYSLLLFTINGDRKSTRLNSSHSQISYAVFCLKKKTKKKTTTPLTKKRHVDRCYSTRQRVVPLRKGLARCDQRGNRAGLSPTDLASFVFRMRRPPRPARSPYLAHCRSQ